jgi:hypothetical protein
MANIATNHDQERIRSDPGPARTSITRSRIMAALTVQYAVYGALADGNENNSQAADVSAALQASIDGSQGIVTINNDNLGGDPSPGYQKHFGACVALDGTPRYFACQEGQTIDFYHTKP